MNYTVDSLRMLVTGQAGLKDLSGPVGIVNAVDDMYQEAAPAGFGVCDAQYDELRCSADNKSRNFKSASAPCIGRRNDLFFL